MGEFVVWDFYSVSIFSVISLSFSNSCGVGGGGSGFSVSRGGVGGGVMTYCLISMGVIRVVPMTMSRTALKISSEKTPDDRPKAAMINPNSPRGIMHIPTVLPCFGVILPIIAPAKHPPSLLTIAIKSMIILTATMNKSSKEPKSNLSPIITKNIGTKTSAIGLSSPWIMSRCSVFANKRPATNAPNIPAMPTDVARKNEMKHAETAKTRIALLASILET